MNCQECGGSILSWEVDTAPACGTPADGRLSARDVHARAVLGCDECSATVRVLHSTDIANLLNAVMALPARLRKPAALPGGDYASGHDAGQESAAESLDDLLSNAGHGR
jgi:hypothetical protein